MGGTVGDAEGEGEAGRGCNGGGGGGDDGHGDDEGVRTGGERKQSREVGQRVPQTLEAVKNQQEGREVQQSALPPADGTEDTHETHAAAGIACLQLKCMSCKS